MKYEYIWQKWKLDCWLWCNHWWGTCFGFGCRVCCQRPRFRYGECDVWRTSSTGVVCSFCRFVGNKRYLIVVLTLQEINWRNRQQNGCNSANYLYFWTKIYIIIYICICNEKIRVLALHEHSLTDIWTKLCVSTWIFRVIHIIYIILVLKVKGTYS